MKITQQYKDNAIATARANLVLAEKTVRQIQKNKNVLDDYDQMLAQAQRNVAEAQELLNQAMSWRVGSDV